METNTERLNLNRMNPYTLLQISVLVKVNIKSLLVEND